MNKEKENATPEVNTPEQQKYRLVAELIERINNHKPISKEEYHISVLLDSLECLLESMR